jgi:antitoxin Phd
MKSWSIKDAGAHLGELVDRARAEGPQALSLRGQNQAVVVSIEEWNRLTGPATRSLKELLGADEARTDDLVPQRLDWPMRAPPVLD